MAIGETRMNIAIVGLWHLGCVTAACLADSEHTVYAYDSDQSIINNLQQNKSPIFEPGLNELLKKGKENKKLFFSHDISTVSGAEIVWITFDTPVDDNDIADVNFVTSEIEKICSYLSNNTLVLISSQLPVGTTRKLYEFCSKNFPKKAITFAYSPENLRLGKAIEVFTKPDRVVIGIEKESDKERLQNLFQPWTSNIIWMSIESAEMTKHALNAFLATSVVFINELSTICEKVGADAREVERGLKSEERIGPKAYLRPGAAIAGGTLLRDINFLIQAGQQRHIATPFFTSLLKSNTAHKQWAQRQIQEVLQNFHEKNIVMLGLTYKVGTDTLRRSTAVEMCEWLYQQGATVSAFDPLISKLPSHLATMIDLKANLENALQGAYAVIIGNECPEFTSLTAEKIIANVKQPIIIDASGFLFKQLSQDNRIKYYTVGSHSWN